MFYCCVETDHLVCIYIHYNIVTVAGTETWCIVMTLVLFLNNHNLYQDCHICHPLQGLKDPQLVSSDKVA